MSWPLFLADVSTAFLQGLTFEELAKLNGGQAREVCFTPPANSAQYFKELKGMDSYNPSLHVLRMKKPVYGLKDAPKAWRTKLDMVLKEGGGKPLHTDQSLYSWHNSSGSLVLLLSTHVDDLKGCGEEAEVTKVLALLTKHFGKLKTDRLKFEHCGVWHEQDLAAKAVYMHQAHYSAQLKLMEIVGLDPTKPEVALNEKQASEYMSLLGALGWLTQTRLDLSIYICALQRAAKSPRAEHAFRLNKVCKWARRKKRGLLYRKVKTPIRVVTVSDAAF
jgi:hypothetical protein